MALTRSESLTNLPIIERDARTGMAEDIRNTWTKKSKKVASLTGAHICEFHNLRRVQKNEQPAGTSICAEPSVMESDPFILCGNLWSLKIFPHGVDEDSEFLSVKLQNKSEETVNAYYTLAIKRSDRSDDANRLNMWVDPDLCALIFQPEGHEDSAWGVDDFLPLPSLYSKELGYMDIFADVEPAFNKKTNNSNALYGEVTPTDDNAGAAAHAKLDNSAAQSTRTAHQGDNKAHNLEVDVPCEVLLFRNSKGEIIYDRLYVEVQMMRYGEVSWKAHPITQAIEQKNASEAELIQLADMDLDLIRQATKGGGPTLAQLSLQQDNILTKLCPPSRIAEEKTRQKSVFVHGSPSAQIGSEGDFAIGTGKTSASMAAGMTASRPDSRGAVRPSSRGAGEHTPSRAPGQERNVRDSPKGKAEDIASNKRAAVNISTTVKFA